MPLAVSWAYVTKFVSTTDHQTPTGANTDYAGAAISRVLADNVIEYAYREAGDVPLVLLQHFRGNLDNWDPALIDDLAAQRRVVPFDDVGVGGTTATTPNTIAAMAYGAIAFIEAMAASCSSTTANLRQTSMRCLPTRDSGAKSTAHGSRVGSVPPRRASPLASSRSASTSRPAFAIALTKRLCTFYLPPLWGYPALQWLRRKGSV